MWYITPLLFATVILADYYIDNANTSVVYSIPPSQTGLVWKTLSVNTKPLSFNVSDSTGNHTFSLDASHCYDQN